MTREQAVIGQRVKALEEFISIPIGTEGVIDEQYDLSGRLGWTIAWDLPDRPLPENWHYTGQLAIEPGVPLRDGFSEGELQFLEVVENGPR